MLYQRRAHLQSRPIQEKPGRKPKSVSSCRKSHVHTVSMFTHRPFLSDVNEQLMDVFGYCIAPINYGSRRIGFGSTSRFIFPL